jgi:hypothetical protein
MTRTLLLISATHRLVIYVLELFIAPALQGLARESVSEYYLLYTTIPLADLPQTVLHSKA